MTKQLLPDTITSSKPVVAPLINVDDLETFNRIYEELSKENGSASVEEIKRCGILYSENYTFSIKLFKLAVCKSLNNKTLTVDLMIYLAALYFTHGLCPNKLLKTLDDCPDIRLSIIRGYQYYSMGCFMEALFEFSKINYSKGINMCNVMLNEDKKILDTNDIFFMALISSTYWDQFIKHIKKLEITTTPSFDCVSSVYNKNVLLDVLYRIGYSEIYNCEDSIDVSLTEIEKNFNQDVNTLEELLALKRDHSGIYSAEIDYLIGKAYHLKNDISNAKSFYEKSLAVDSLYIPALYNLSRIKQTSILCKENLPGNSFTVIEDYNALLALKRFDYAKDVIKCSSEVRRLYNTVIGANELDLSSISLIEGAIDSLTQNSWSLILGISSLAEDNFEVIRLKAKLLNNLGIIYALNYYSRDKQKSINCFNKALSLLENSHFNSEDFSQLIKFNRRLVKDDEEGDFFEENSILYDTAAFEIQKVIDYSRSVNINKYPLVKAYSMMDSQPEESIRLFRNNDSSLYSSLCLGHIYLNCNRIEEAINVCLSHKDSFYAANIIAVGYYKLGYYRESMVILEQIKDQLSLRLHYFLPSILNNLANVSYKLENYSRCVEFILQKISLTNNISESLKKQLISSCYILNNLELLNSVLKVLDDSSVVNIKTKSTLATLRKFKIELLLKDNKFDAARKYSEDIKISENAEIKEVFNRYESREKEIKRRLDEISEYRKKKKFM